MTFLWQIQSRLDTRTYANQVGQNKIAINFIWTLVTGFLVMFMQAGFAMVESGLCRVKNANHTYMMNFFVYTAVCSPTGS